MEGSGWYCAQHGSEASCIECRRGIDRGSTICVRNFSCHCFEPVPGIEMVCGPADTHRNHSVFCQCSHSSITAALALLDAVYKGRVLGIHQLEMCLHSCSNTTFKLHSITRAFNCHLEHHIMLSSTSRTHRAHTQTPHTTVPQRKSQLLRMMSKHRFAWQVSTPVHLAYFIAILERPAQCNAAPEFWREACHNLCHTSHGGCRAQLLGLAKGRPFQTFNGNSGWLRPLGHILTSRLHVMKCTDSSVCSQGATASDLAHEDAFAYFAHCCRRHANREQQDVSRPSLRAGTDH